MTFDEQLKRAVDTLGDRLRENLARELRAVTDKLAEAQAVQRASGAAAVQAPPAASHDLVVAFRAIDEAGSLSEILETVATRAAREAARAAVLLVRGGSVRSWRLVGFPSSGDTHIDIPFVDAGIVADAVRSGLTTRAIASGHPAPAFAELPAGAEALAVPIALAGEVVAVLYADVAGRPPTTSSSGVQIDDSTWVDRVEILVRHAARSLEAITAFKTARALTGPVGGVKARSAHTTTDDEAARRYARFLSKASAS